MKRGQANPKAWPEEITVRGWERYRAHFGIKPPIRCRCGDVGFIVKDVPVRHPDFGRLYPCPDCSKKEPKAEPDHSPYTTGDW